MVRQDLVRGQMLVAQGEPSDALFVVLHGALAVRKSGDPRRYRRASRRRTGRRNRFLRQRAAHRRCDCDPRHQRAGADARRLSRTGRTRSGDRRGGARGAGAALRQGDGAPHPDPRFADGANGGADPGRIRTGPGSLRSPPARRAGGDRCRDRRSRPSRDHVSRPGAGFVRSHRLAQQDRADRAAGGLSRRRRRFGLDPQGHSPGRHGRVRHAGQGAGRRRADRGRDLRLQDSSGLGAPPGSHSRRGAAARSAAPRPGSPACRAS